MIRNDFPLEELEDPDLYYKFVKSQDVLVPFDKMAYRESRNASVHIEKMTQHEVGSIERDFHKELAKRSLNRQRKWIQYDKNQHS